MPSTCSTRTSTWRKTFPPPAAPLPSEAMSGSERTLDGLVPPAARARRVAADARTDSVVCGCRRLTRSDAAMAEIGTAVVRPEFHALAQAATRIEFGGRRDRRAKLCGVRTMA